MILSGSIWVFVPHYYTKLIFIIIIFILNIKLLCYQPVMSNIMVATLALQKFSNLT